MAVNRQFSLPLFRDLLRFLIMFRCIRHLSRAWRAAPFPLRSAAAEDLLGPQLNSRADVAKLLASLTRFYGGDESRARRDLRAKLSVEDRRVFDAMLPKRPAHRPKSPATAVKDIELLTFYDLAKTHHSRWSNRKIAQEYTLRHRGKPCANEDAIRAAIQRLRQAEKRSRHLMR